MKKYLLTLLITFSITRISAQTSDWFTLPAAPSNNIKIDDIFFINSMTGWVANGQWVFKLYRTDNGGYNWSQLSAPSAFYRSIGFANANDGWVGDLDEPIIYRTTNGGFSWIETTIPGTGSTGVCGIHVIDSNIVMPAAGITALPIFIKPAIEVLTGLL